MSGFCWDTWIRTKIHGFKVRCAAIAPYPKAVVSRHENSTMNSRKNAKGAANPIVRAALSKSNARSGIIFL